MQLNVTHGTISIFLTILSFEKISKAARTVDERRTKNSDRIARGANLGRKIES